MTVTNETYEKLQKFKDILENISERINELTREFRDFYETPENHVDEPRYERKFKIGNFVKATVDTYAITTPNVFCEVVDTTHCDKLIHVKTLTGDVIGVTFWVHAADFTKIEITNDKFI